ncbi:MAG TPA: succinyl-diaminopimelate desuccinylase [Gammaproteobacteria bacterium]|nr:succinyl-diaminopimelate desuccinylase [Gammaproteobacteria bacterium]
MNDPVDLALELISRRSVTPDDAGCQTIIAEQLAAAGFTVEHLPFGAVSNLWARLGNSAPLVVFAGHTDVVPPGPQGAWSTPPFTPTVRDGHLYGRGAADMKGALAAMIAAAEDFAATGDPQGSLAFLITSDEEGTAVDGTARVIETLTGRGIRIDHCIVGEASSRNRVGDMIRHGRRGSLHGRLTVHGIQGHVAYPDSARNPIHAALPALAELTAMRWDDGNEHFPPTRLQISNIHSGTGADNVIPGSAEALFNFRYSTASTAEGLQAQVEALLKRHELEYSLNWRDGGRPFLTEPGLLTDAVTRAICAETGYEPELSTGGGTSDGRFIAPAGAAVVELGPVNASIHKVDEHVSIDELRLLARIYRRVLDELLRPSGCIFSN